MKTAGRKPIDTRVVPLDRLDDVQARLDTDAWQPRSLTHDEALVVGSAPCGMGGCGLPECGP